MEINTNESETAVSCKIENNNLKEQQTDHTSLTSISNENNSPVLCSSDQNTFETGQNMDATDSSKAAAFKFTKKLKSPKTIFCCTRRRLLHKGILPKLPFENFSTEAPSGVRM
ncbi:hypothetical protein KQX54_019028 [Cotesia glomerata]|uniref:Uncharacterized protein n=1 Tax=Cotesia glomerata TaxID=32391 RepID=A0AAV7IN44_COTGL|nr:hypothetical protein KQX54_019028 [Cotesia glomerata]